MGAATCPLELFLRMGTAFQHQGKLQCALDIYTQVCSGSLRLVGPGGLLSRAVALQICEILRPVLSWMSTVLASVLARALPARCQVESAGPWSETWSASALPLPGRGVAGPGEGQSAVVLRCIVCRAARQGPALPCGLGPALSASGWATSWRQTWR